MYIVPNPIEVRAIEKYKIYIKFKNGEEKILDMKEMLDKKYQRLLPTSRYWRMNCNRS